jgi:c-di-GMP-binding flagellar brake protein YcgR
MTSEPPRRLPSAERRRRPTPSSAEHLLRRGDIIELEDRPGERARVSAVVGPVAVLDRLVDHDDGTVVFLASDVSCAWRCVGVIASENERTTLRTVEVLDRVQRRSYVRLPLAQWAEVHRAGPHSMAEHVGMLWLPVLDVSAGGIALVDAPFEVGATVLVRTELWAPGGALHIDAPAVVVRRTESAAPVLLGCEWTDLDPAFQQHLAAYVTAASSRRARTP